MTFRSVGAICLYALLSSSVSAQKLSGEVVHIADDKRCESALHGVTDDERALATGCARFWPQWPKDNDADKATIERRIVRLQNVWISAQINGRGHYAPIALGPPQQGARAPLPAGGGTSAAGDGSIRAMCAKEWPDDFQMRAFCEKQQNEASAKLAARSMTSTDEQTIRRKCLTDWPNDLKMRDFCEEQQLQALRSLR